MEIRPAEVHVHQGAARAHAGRGDREVAGHDGLPDPALAAADGPDGRALSPHCLRGGSSGAAFEGKFTTAADAPVPNAQITLDHAIAVNHLDEIRLWTPTDNVPVRVVAHGANGFQVDGLGIRANIPAMRDRKGKVVVTRQGEFRFSIAARPVLVRGNTRISSRGSLHYRESLSSGIANVSMHDMVVVRGLTTDKDDVAIVKAMIGLGRSLRLDVIAEGVETEVELGILADLGCQEAQGYLICRPVPPEELEAWVQARDRARELAPNMVSA